MTGDEMVLLREPTGRSIVNVSWTLAKGACLAVKARIGTRAQYTELVCYLTDDYADQHGHHIYIKGS